MFIMDVNMEALLVIRLVWQKVPYHSFQHSFQPYINIPSQNYWLHLPPALPLLAISECQRRMWGRRKEIWKKVDDEGKKWGAKELFSFFIRPYTLLAYDLEKKEKEKKETNLCKYLSLKWDSGVTSYGAKQVTTYENHPFKLFLVTVRYLYCGIQ